MIYIIAHLHHLIYKMAIYTELAKFRRVPQSALAGGVLGGSGSRLPPRDTLLGSNKLFGQASRHLGSLVWRVTGGWGVIFCHMESESLGMRVNPRWPVPAFAESCSRHFFSNCEMNNFHSRQKITMISSATPPGITNSKFRRLRRFWGDLQHLLFTHGRTLWNQLPMDKSRCPRGSERQSDQMFFPSAKGWEGVQEPLRNPRAGSQRRLWGTFPAWRHRPREPAGHGFCNVKPAMGMTVEPGKSVFIMILSHGLLYHLLIVLLLCGILW